jgi:hypothetical protein
MLRLDLISRSSRILISFVTANRHRGKGRPFAPATPPDMRVRIRRFSSVELERREQAWNAERVKVRNGKRERQRRAVR